MAAVSLSSAFASANRGPLTTIYTPPASCLSTTTLASYPTTLLENTTSTFITTKIFINHYSWGDGSCYPSTIATVAGATKWGNGYYYSPGICPSGWASACEFTNNVWGFATNIASATSAVMCCPSNWSCVGGTTTLTAHGCSTMLYAQQTLTNVWSATPTPGTVLSIPSKKSVTEWVVPSDTSALCDGVPVMWQSTDVQILSLLAAQVQATSNTTSGTSSSTAGSSVSSSTSISLVGSSAATTSSSTSTAVPSAGLTTGAKAAIGVVIPIVFLAAILGIFFFFRRRNRKLERHELPATGDSATDQTGTLLKVFEKDGAKGKTTASELDSQVMFEVDGRKDVPEMEGHAPVFEMPGDMGHQPPSYKR